MDLDPGELARRLLAGALRDAHRDPADRFIMAQAMLEDATLLTADRAILVWSGALDRRDARL